MGCVEQPRSILKNSGLVQARKTEANRRRLPDDYTIAELHAIATRALANGDDYARALLREQLEREEFRDRSDIAPGTGAPIDGQTPA